MNVYCAWNEIWCKKKRWRIPIKRENIWDATEKTMMSENVIEHVILWVLFTIYENSKPLFLTLCWQKQINGGKRRDRGCGENPFLSRPLPKGNAPLCVPSVCIYINALLSFSSLYFSKGYSIKLARE